MPVARRDQKTLHGLFEERARQAPDRIALEHEGRRITNAELNREANRIARHLREVNGVRPDDRVAILVRDPVRTVVAVLAILKAGGAYIPLDPDNPPGMTHHILDDSTPTAVVLESALSTSVAFFPGDLFVIDVMSADLEFPDADLDPLSTPEHLAYVIYTSGTTGNPKGVAIEHRSIVNTITWRNAFYQFGPNDVTLAIPRPSFDSSVEDTFCTLTAGGELVLPKRDRITDRGYLVDLMVSRKITHFLITPTLYKRLLGGLDARNVSTLRTVTVAGEWLTLDLVHEHYRRLPHVRLYNEYGPTENSVCSTAHLLRRSDTRVLIGRPIDNTEAFVITERGMLAQPGQTGELFLAGVGLARCYLGKPELTDEKFVVASSCSPMGQRRVYRTGDIVRVCEDGNLQFVGRHDGQVKIRGHRVELAQVAECLARDHSVADVFVSQHIAPSAPPQLIAYVVGPNDTEIERLRTSARESLPSYMVPTAILSVDRLPLTNNGKVDEAVLRSMYENSLGGEQTPEPTSTIASSLLSVWRRLLPRQRIRLEDDFFELGGDSLTVMDLVAVVDVELGIQLDSADVYTGRTIKSLARLIENRQHPLVEPH
ncbi:MAG TPA: non-ribosomal peptide synthetase [Galbitalea sp.]|nr:non-ribosomal peptide synthetase [Galbitalea sp.]